MAQDTIILTPQCVEAPRYESKAIGATLQTGVFAQYTAGGCQAATAAEAGYMITVENIATAQGIGYTYAENERVFLAAPPRGCTVKLKAVAATYADAAELEIGANGQVVAKTTGVRVGVVPVGEGKTITAGQSLVVQLT